MTPTNSPTQGQPNPRKIRLKVAFGPLFPTANIFSWVGVGFMQETDYKKTNPMSPQTPHFWLTGLLSHRNSGTTAANTIGTPLVFYEYYLKNRVTPVVPTGHGIVDWAESTQQFLKNQLWGKMKSYLTPFTTAAKITPQSVPNIVGML